LTSRSIAHAPPALTLEPEPEEYTYRTNNDAVAYSLAHITDNGV
jgi:hypothetical protein